MKIYFRMYEKQLNNRSKVTDKLFDFRLYTAYSRVLEDFNMFNQKDLSIYQSKISREPLWILH